jgi:hypothetical protein
LKRNASNFFNCPSKGERPNLIFPLFRPLPAHIFAPVQNDRLRLYSANPLLLISGEKRCKTPVLPTIQICGLFWVGERTEVLLFVTRNQHTSILLFWAFPLAHTEGNYSASGPLLPSRVAFVIGAATHCFSYL